jgi:hypothetical protein
MARFGTFTYGTELYGRVQRGTATGFLLAQALDYSAVRVTVYAESRVGAQYALIRTKSGAAEEPSAGITVASGTIDSPELIVVDGETNFNDSAQINNVPVPVGPVYYTLFIFDEDGRWLKDAATYVVVPRQRATADFMIQTLPRVFTTETLSPTDEPSTDSDLYRFLYGLGVAFDEFQTLTDRVLPTAARSRATLPGLHDAHCRSVGMPVEITLGLGTTSRLFREAGFIYRNKGTVNGLLTYTEALTGWGASVSPSPNKLLSLQDSSFEGGTGSWSASGGTLTAHTVDETGAPVSDFDLELDPFAADFVGRLELADAEAVLQLPGDVLESEGTSTTRSAQRLLSIPVSSSSVFVSLYWLAQQAGTQARIGVSWLDEHGAAIDGLDLAASEGVPQSWTRTVHEFTVPTSAAFAVLSVYVIGSAGDVIFLDKLQVSEADTYYRDPRSVDVLCHPIRVNLLTTPGVGGTHQWTTATGSVELDAGSAYAGTAGLLMSGESGFVAVSESVPAMSDAVMSVAAQIKSEEVVSVSLEFLDADGAVIELPVPSDDALEILEVGIAQGSTGSGDWEWVQAKFLTPQEAREVRVRVSASGDASIDNIILERTDREQYFFDVTTADSGDEDAVAVEVDGHIYSALYPNRLSKLSRLRQTLSFYLPLDMRARVLLWSDDVPGVVDSIPYGN